MSSISELRQDLVSGDWVVIATGRGKRPHDFLKEKAAPFVQPRSACPFESLHRDAVLVLYRGGARIKKEWTVQVVPNKYPAFAGGICAEFRPAGPYQVTDGTGFHEVVVTRDHARSIAEQPQAEIAQIVRAYQERYLAMKQDDCAAYISIFENHGRQAGATVAHPHSQIIAMPVIPPDVGRSLKGSDDYFRRHRECVHCVMLQYELKAKERLVYENAECAVVAPFASKTAFELRIFPKTHQANFEAIAESERRALAAALRVALAKLAKGLRKPDYNFFLHTAPAADTGKFSHYHWHLEILPKTAIWAGFELGTGIEISTISPESAAEFLRGISV